VKQKKKKRTKGGLKGGKGDSHQAPKEKKKKQLQEHSGWGDKETHGVASRGGWFEVSSP